MRVIDLCVWGLAGMAGLGAACSGDGPARPTLSLTCAANPSSGVAPLTVAFEVAAAGAEGALSFAIDYGDGTTGADVGAVHRYANAGSYTAAFTARTARQSALCTTTVRVHGVPAPSPTPPPASGPNQPPVAEFHTTPPASGGVISGRTRLSVQFSMCATTDPEGDVLRFQMDFQGDGSYEVSGTTGADCRRSHDYHPGTYAPHLCVTDLGSSLLPLHADQCRSYAVKIKG